MNTVQINNLLKSYKHFIGVFPINRIPKKVNIRPAALVINTDPDSKPGEHWVVLYLDRDGSADYFDSYGLPPLNKEILEFMSTHSSFRSRYNSLTLQNIFSTTCGQYCVLYIKHRLSGGSHCEFVNQFSSLNTIANDEYVTKNFRRY